jgi:hypothetical protein
MGWSSGNEVFDPVARELQVFVPDDTARSAVASVLINALQECDWDTEDESLDQFRDDPAIIAAFATNGVSHTHNR